MKATWIGAVIIGMAGAAFGETVRFEVDAGREAKPISRYIYGVNQKLEGPYANMAFARAGGNRWTAYNWVTNASNAGSDWNFQNDNLMGKEDVPGGAVIGGLDNARRGAAFLVTMPIAGYVSADKKGDGDVRKSGADYLKTRFKPMVAKKGAAFSLTPDPEAANVYADEFVNWIMTTCPYAATDATTPIFFSMDNEPDLWSHTHAEIHPKPVGYEELVKLTVENAAAIKAVAPKTLIFGPANYGWMGFVRLQNAPDAKDRDFQEYYLQKMAVAEKTGGKRLLDVLDVHWYPEARGGGVRIVGPESGKATVEARVQAPRSLWDGSYKEDSWIANDVLRGPVKLLPTLMGKIERNYKGTKLAVTEYNYGGGGHISGGIAQADVLGIFGREGVFAAAMWSMAKDESYIAGGFRMFRDFDGKGGSFGDTSVFAGTDKIAETSVYASTDSGNGKRMVLVAINKTERVLTAEVRVKGKGIVGGSTHVLAAGSAEPKAGKGIVVGEAGKFEYEMPAWSVTTIELMGK